MIVRRKGNIKLLIVNTVIFLVYFNFIFRAYNSGLQTSVVSFILAAETSFVTLFSFIFLKDRENVLVKIVGGVLVTAGLILIG